MLSKEKRLDLITGVPDVIVQLIWYNCVLRVSKLRYGHSQGVHLVPPRIGGVAAIKKRCEASFESADGVVRD
jgi:hypothetical protein